MDMTRDDEISCAQASSTPVQAGKFGDRNGSPTPVSQ
jgi:hypothetical protein